MIFDRLTGLDLGPPPSFLIPGNIKLADAPVRYPFLWNAPKQDKTQWPGFLANGNDLLGLARNLGEVYGVFGVFEPKKDLFKHFLVDYLNNNSANFDGLGKLEDLVKQIGPPEWPWQVDTKLAKEGETIYKRPTKQGGCSDCHGIRPGEIADTWATPRIDAGIDTREWDILQWRAQTGVFKGAPIPPGLPPPLRFFGTTDKAFELLSAAVLGSVIQHSLPLKATGEEQQTQETLTMQPELFHLPPALQDLPGAFLVPGGPSPIGKLTPQTPGPVFEAKVLGRHLGGRALSAQWVHPHAL